MKTKKQKSPKAATAGAGSASAGLSREDRIVESLSAAAARTGFSLEAVKAAKRAGCKAFKPNNRIDVFELAEWFAEHSEIIAVSETDLTMDQAARLEAIAKALTRWTNYLKLRRALVQESEMRSTFTRAYVAVRAKFLAMSSGLAQKLAQLRSGDPVVVDSEIRAKVLEALGQLEKEPWLAECPHCGKEI